MFKYSYMVVFFFALLMLDLRRMVVMQKITDTEGADNVRKFTEVPEYLERKQRLREYFEEVRNSNASVIMAPYVKAIEAAPQYRQDIIEMAQRDGLQPRWIEEALGLISQPPEVKNFGDLAPPGKNQWSRRPLVLGLTGGIASGKSTARELLRDLGADVVDADRYGHKCYEPGSACFGEVVSSFGQSIVQADGTLNRRALGAIVFNDRVKLQELNDIVWPYIRRMIKRDIEQHRAQPEGVLVVEAAVMIEAGWHDMFDEVWVMKISPEAAQTRLMQRNNLSPDEAQKRIKSQMSNEERGVYGTQVIPNDGSLEELEKSVRQAWKELLAVR